MLRSKKKQKGGILMNRIEMPYASMSALLAPLGIISFDWNAAYHYGQIRAFLEENGMIIGERIYL